MRDDVGVLDRIAGAWAEAEATVRAEMRQGGVDKGVVFGARIKPVDGRSTLKELVDAVELDWFGRDPLIYDGALYLPAEHNLAVNSGLEIAARRTFQMSNIPGGGGTSSNAGGVVGGGVDSGTAAVANSTHQFNTGTNATTHFVRFVTNTFVSGPSYGLSGNTGTITASFQITDTNFTPTSSDQIHRRYGLHNNTNSGSGSAANSASSLFSMLSGFILDFNSKAYDITVETRTQWTGT